MLFRSVPYFVQLNKLPRSFRAMLDTDRFNVYYGWSCDIIVAALFPSGKAESVIFKLGCSTGFAGKGVGSSVADNSGLDMGPGRVGKCYKRDAGPLYGGFCRLLPLCAAIQLVCCNAFCAFTQRKLYYGNRGVGVSGWISAASAFRTGEFCAE